MAHLRVAGDNDSGEPIDQYREDVKKGTTSTLPYERLMIYYRKNKMYEDELAVIRKGIETLGKFYADHQKQALNKKLNPALVALSKKFGKQTGLIDRKGNSVHLPDPLPRWHKRAETVEGKLEAQKIKVKPAKKNVRKKRKEICKAREVTSGERLRGSRVFMLLRTGINYLLKF